MICFIFFAILPFGRKMKKIAQYLFLHKNCVIFIFASLKFSDFQKFARIVKSQGVQEGLRIFEKNSSPMRRRHCPPPPPPSRLYNVMIAFLSKTSCHRNLRKEEKIFLLRSLSALWASDPSLRSVNRPIGPWLSTHDEATRVPWHREGRTFLKDSLPFLDSLWLN